jgi:chloride channel protein, CIC family
MRKHIAEESTLFVSVLKWSALASIVGVFVGGSTSLFLKALKYCTDSVQGVDYYVFLLPAALLLSNLLATLIDKEAAGEGLDKVIDSIHANHGKIKFRVGPAKFIASIITIAGGGSVGKEAPPVQVGAALASSAARLFRMDRTDRRKLVICAISAGFASVFGAPIAGAIFAIESLFLGQLLYDVLFPSFVAGIVSYQVTLHLGVRYFTRDISIVPAFTGGLFFKVILAGIIFGLVALLLIEVMKRVGEIFDRIKLSLPIKGGLAGFILLGATLALGDKRYLGLGLDTIEGAAMGHHIPAYAFLVKIVFTAISLGSGASGGIITPIFFIGASAGNVLGGIFGFEPATFAAIGIAAVLAGAANTPIAAGILAMELFGVKIGPWAATASVVSYLMVGNRSIHASQVVASLKSASVVVPLKEKIGGADVQVLVRDKGVLGMAKKAYEETEKAYEHRFKKKKDTTDEGE